MTNSTANFTAAQVLQAARRAEAEGKTEYALQFYRHLVDHYPDAPEAHEAREGLQRLARWRPPPGPGSIGGHERNLHQPGPLRGGAAPGLGAEAAQDIDPYRFGRLASRIFVWLGVLVAIAGLVFAGYIAWTTPPQLWADSLIGFPMPSFWGLVVAVIGFAMVVAGQVAGAVFDGAEAVNVLLEDERFRS